MTTKSIQSPSNEVTDFISNIQHPLKPGFETLRQIILNSDPGISEHIKWNAPSFIFKGDDRITFSNPETPSTAGCIVIIFHRGAKVKSTKDFSFEDATGLFEWKTKDRATVKLTSLDEIEHKKDLITSCVKNWLSATI